MAFCNKIPSLPPMSPNHKLSPKPHWTEVLISCCILSLNGTISFVRSTFSKLNLWNSKEFIFENFSCFYFGWTWQEIQCVTVKRMQECKIGNMGTVTVQALLP